VSVTCQQCGFSAGRLTRMELVAMLTDQAEQLAMVLPGTSTETLTHRPGAAWSGGQYAGHLVEVLILFDRRVHDLLARDDPELEVVDHDAVVSCGAYDDLSGQQLAEQVAHAARRLSTTFRQVPEDAWNRSGWRAGERRSIADTLERGVHELVHHSSDIAAALGSAPARAQP
jgi:hypothetical protein